MDKEGHTLINAMLIFAFLVVGIILLMQMGKINAWQTKQVEEDIAKNIVAEVKGMIEKAQAYPSDGRYKMYMDFAEPYDLVVRRNSISITLTRRGITFTDRFFSNDINVLPSNFSSSGVIDVIKNDNSIYVTNRLLCNPGDSVCDPGCGVVECDPRCYSNREDGVCNPYCIDSDNDYMYTIADKDGICDLDCAGPFKDNAYDMDCAISGDGRCDPDQDGLSDSVCDEDCLGSDGICDPDCHQADPDCR